MLKNVAFAQIALALALGWLLTWPHGASSGNGGALAAAPDGARDIVIEHFAYSATPMTVAAGTTVRWTNRDEEPHTVTASDGTFASPGLDDGESFSHRFDRPGTYTYFCSLHPHMTGQIIVR